MKRQHLSIMVFFCTVNFLLCSPLLVFSQLLDFDEAERFHDPLERNLRLYKEIKFVAGKDNLWFTEDDEIFHYFLAEYDRRGKMIRKTCLQKGKDDIWFTADDEVQNYNVYKYDRDGNAARELAYNNKGADGEWFTPDDAIEYYSLYEDDSQGREIKAVRYNARNEVIGYITYSYNPQGLILEGVKYAGKGLDNVWFTPDDVVEKYHRRRYNDKGWLVSAQEYYSKLNGAGPDGKWFTSDDVISSARVFEYDAQGLVTKTKKYNSPGPDGVWITEDDVPQYYTIRYFTKIK